MVGINEIINFNFSCLCMWWDRISSIFSFYFILYFCLLVSLRERIRERERESRVTWMRTWETSNRIYYIKKISIKGQRQKSKNSTLLRIIMIIKCNIFPLIQCTNRNKNFLYYIHLNYQWGKITFFSLKSPDPCLLNASFILQKK